MQYKYLLIACAVILSSCPAHADTTSGFDTTIPNMLFAVQGQQVGNWTSSQLSLSTGLTTTGAVGVGVGVASPVTELDVLGGIRTGYDGNSCAGANEGTQRYNLLIHNYEFCNGTNWQPLGGGLTTVVGGCQTSWSSCPSGYQATAYFSPGTYNCCDKCGNPSWKYTVCSQ